MKTIAPLQKGDLIAIVAPAKHIEPNLVHTAAEILKQHGYNVIIGDNCFNNHNYFSATTVERTADFNWAIRNPNVKAILCARGGYGTVQILEDIDWPTFEKQPKWVIGFSDITFLHQKLNALGYPSIHGTVPLNFQTHTADSLSTLLDALTGKTYTITAEPSDYNIIGATQGQLVGGNLAVFCTTIGTSLMPDLSKKILFIEDVGEAIYSIDRMFYQLKSTSLLNKISGVVVGGFSSMRDSDPPFGKTVEQIIHEHIKNYDIPLTFNIDSGHITRNLALRMNTQCQLEVNSKGAKITFEPI